MNVAEKVEAAFADVVLLYGRVPEFGGNEPEKYAVYTVTEMPEEFAEGGIFHTVSV